MNTSTACRCLKLHIWWQQDLILAGEERELLDAHRMEIGTQVQQPLGPRALRSEECVQRLDVSCGAAKRSPQKASVFGALLSLAVKQVWLGFPSSIHLHNSYLFM